MTLARTYAGVGARITPAGVLELMTELGHALALNGWTLRSGGAPGGDQAFYAGASRGGGAIELFLPWPGFESRHVERYGEPTLKLERPAGMAAAISSEYHPNWSALDKSGRKLQARNVHTVLGERLDPAQRIGLLICWTPDQTLDGRGHRGGGTGQTIRIAHHHGIPVRNLARSEHRAAAEEWLAAHRGT